MKRTHDFYYDSFYMGNQTPFFFAWPSVKGSGITTYDILMKAIKRASEQCPTIPFLFLLFCGFHVLSGFLLFGFAWDMIDLRYYYGRKSFRAGWQSRDTLVFSCLTTIKKNLLAKRNYP